MLGRQKGRKGSAVLDEKTALDHLMERVRSALELLPPGSAQMISQQLDHTAQQAESLPLPSSETRQVIKRLGGREYSSEERISLEALSLLEEFRYRRQLLDNSLTAPQVAEIIGSSRQTPYDRAKSGSLLATMDRGALRFPSWQFDPEGENGVVQGLTAVARSLHLSPLEKIGWFAFPNPYLEGKTPIAVLRAGQVQRVEELARGAGRT